MRTVLAAILLIIAGAGCNDTTCDDLCEEDLDDCLDQATTPAEQSECHRSFDMCTAVCNGRSD